MLVAAVPPVGPAVPQCVGFDVLFRDEHVLVVTKPPRMLVHPAPRTHKRHHERGKGGADREEEQPADTMVCLRALFLRAY